MKHIFALFLSLFLLQCGPRDDASLNNGSGAGTVSLKAGGTLSVSQEGQKLSTCSQPGDPSWNSIRLFAELNFMFDKVDRLKAIVSKGTYNCTPVSLKNTVSIDLQQAPQSKDYKKSAYYHVTKIEIRNTSDVLNSPELLNTLATDMAMTSDQLKNYLLSPPQKSQINISYLKPADETKSKADNNKDSLQEGDFKLPAGNVLYTKAEGGQLPTCSSDSDVAWQTLNLPFEIDFLKDRLDQLQLLVLKGTKNCLQVSNKKTVELQTALSPIGVQYQGTQHYYLVDALQMMHLEDLLADEKLLETVAKQMAMSVEELKAYLLVEPVEPIITLSFLTAHEQIIAPTVDPILSLSLPEAQGKTLSSDCKKTWSDIRLNDELLSKIQQAIDSKKFKAFVQSGDLNCLPIGAEIKLSTKDSQGHWQNMAHITLKVSSVTLLDKSYFSEIPTLKLATAQDMGLSVEDFLKYLESLKDQKVNITRFEWLEN